MSQFFIVITRWNDIVDIRTGLIGIYYYMFNKICYSPFTLIWLLENFTVLEWPCYISIRCVQIRREYKGLLSPCSSPHYCFLPGLPRTSLTGLLKNFRALLFSWWILSWSPFLIFCPMLMKPQACEHLSPGHPSAPPLGVRPAEGRGLVGVGGTVTGYLGEGLSLFLCLLPYPPGP